ncbi:hypothetical protein EUGRSUZ_A01176 [Eucalyptus grandis]|uniref:Conserved oligomeric Golgi complex subunit 1 n=3 Tax=Eucalyptus grandis TaxID=71139 RepID=A0A059DEE6_EUCGR|nr:hypothetical protein EUGRSUZ_A01176 [Eucalyptus grandis]KAK3445346.1 hypothetical protein EUGRSUZ_A01176 [Eucalyptus grandis]
MPYFYKVTLSSPPASPLFGGIPNPDEEVRLWKSFRDKLESVTTLFEKRYIDCGRKIASKMSDRYPTDAISTGEEIALVEKLIRETMDSKDVLEGSLDWLKSVFGLEIELPWSRIRELVLEADLDLWDEIFEDAFVQRMKSIIDLGFGNSTRDVNIVGSIRTIEETPGEKTDFRAYLSRPSTGGGVWFIEPNDRKTVALPSSKAQAEEINRIRDAVDNYCHRVLEVLLHFLESPKAAIWLKNLAKYPQDRCYESMSSILMQLEGQQFSTDYEAFWGIPVEQLILLSVTAQFGNHPWALEDIPHWQTVAVLGADDIPSSKFKDFSITTRDLCERAHSLWITWLSMELSKILSRDLEQDDGLSSMTPLRDIFKFSVPLCPLSRVGKTR